MWYVISYVLSPINIMVFWIHVFHIIITTHE
jgi:hypothetical protein